MSYAHAPSWLRSSVALLRRATTAAGLTLLVGLGTLNLVSTPDSNLPVPEIGMSSGPLHDIMRHNRCSFTGFDRDVIPSTAIIRTPSGDTKLVSFDRGWKVFTGDLEGQLVAVCLGPKAIDQR